MSDKLALYPLKFSPIFKEKIWGGEKLRAVLGKKIPSSKTGESWEISDVEEDSSVVANGALKGKNLRELISIYKEQLVGEKTYRKFKDHFPLLIKFIDAKKDLSVQLHPDDTLAKERHNSFGKTEMWYVMQADKEARLILDFKEKISQETYLKHLQEKTLCQILAEKQVKRGDVFHISPGLVHAIGKGVLLAEIQQTSDITYRVYDWDRKDTDGNYRELHTELALEAIDLSKSNPPQIHYNAEKNKPIQLVENRYFSTKFIQVEQELSCDYRAQDSFVILMCLEGGVKINTALGADKLIKGECLLLPACCKNLQLEGSAELLEVHIP